MNVTRSTLGLIAAAVLSSGCVTTPGVPPLPDGNVRRLLNSYPQEAEKARALAPEFTRDTLKTISRLEEQGLIRDVADSL